MNSQMIFVVVAFLTAAALTLGANVPNAPNSNATPQALTPGGPPNVVANPNPQQGPQVPGQPGPIPEPGKDGDDSDLKADGFFWGGYGGWGYGGWGGWGGWGRGWGGWGGWGYPYGGGYYRYRPYGWY